MIPVAAIFVVGVMLAAFLATRALNARSDGAMWALITGAVVTVAASATACLQVAQVTLR